MSEDSISQFTHQSKDRLYVSSEETLFREPDHPYAFSYPADYPLTPEFEEQTLRLVREYKVDGEYPWYHLADELGAADDVPDCTALMLIGGGEVHWGDRCPVSANEVRLRETDFPRR